MKNLLLLALLLLVGCSTPGPNLFESTEKLIDTVAFDTDCPKENIHILKDEHGIDWGRYVVKACDKELKYKRVGNVYMAASKNPIEAE